LAKYFAKQDSRSEVVVEASRNSIFPYETIEQYTRKWFWFIRSRREPLPKLGSRPTDTIDATTLAELLGLDGIPKAYIPPEKCVM
jgi:hypothetical protein